MRKKQQQKTDQQKKFEKKKPNKESRYSTYVIHCSADIRQISRSEMQQQRPNLNSYFNKPNGDYRQMTLYRVELTETVVEPISVEVWRQRADTRCMEVLDVVVLSGTTRLQMCRVGS